MPVLLLILLVGVLGWMWWTRRGATLTRACRWREDRTGGVGLHRCVACGATCLLPEGQVPRHCLRKAR